MSYLEISHVSKTYTTGGQMSTRTVQAVRDVSLHVDKGECLGIVGESGSGKSTLGRMLIGVENPDEGTVCFDGTVINSRRMNRNVRRALQMVYQNSYDATDERFRAWEIVEEPLRSFHLAGRKIQRKQRAMELLREVGIPESESDKRAFEYSGGQLQRICIARALAAEPSLILLDEPMSSLDVSVQAQILNLLQDLKQEHDLTYVLISHDLEVVYYLADRLCVMYKGYVVEELDEIREIGLLQHPYSRELMAASRLETAEEEWMEVSENREECGKGCPYAHRCPYAGRDCLEAMPALQKIGKGHRAACHRLCGSEP